MSRKYNKNKVFLIGVILGIILILLFTLIGKQFNKTDVEKTYSNTEKVDQEIEKPVEKKYITIRCTGGDTMGLYKGSFYYATFDIVSI